MQHTVTEHKLGGGAQGLVINVPSSSVVNILIRFNSGYQFVDQSVYEVPHVMEHLMATVTKKYPAANQFMIEAQRNGAYVNATTSSDANGYVYECADFELERILDLVEEQLVRPLFAPEPLKAELGNVREELSRNTTQHASVCNIRLNEAAYPGQAKDYDERITQLDSITLGAVEGHYHANYTAANARFYVAGAFADGGAAVVKRLEKIFAQLPQGERRQRNRATGLNLPEPIVTQRDIKQLYYSADLYGGELTEPERRAMRMLRLVLVGGFGSRILGEARRRGLAYGVGASSHAEEGNSSFGFSGYVTPANAAELFQLIAGQFRAVADGELREEELAAAKDLGIGSALRSHQLPADMLGWYVGPYDDRDEIVNFAEYFELLRQVTRTEIAAVATKFLTTGRHGLSLLGDINSAQTKQYASNLAPLWPESR